jgi:hypothetical protein
LVSGGGKGFRYGLALLISNSVRPLWFDEELVTGTSESDWAETDKGTRNMEDSNPTPTAALFRGRNTFEPFGSHPREVRFTGIARNLQANIEPKISPLM